MCARYYAGHRIHFRPLELEDAPRLATWLNDPENWRTLGRFGPVSRQREREYIEGLYKSADSVVFGIVLSETGELVGCCGLRGIDGPNRSAELGILIGDSAQRNKSFGTEATRLLVRYAFEELNLNRVSLQVFADNARGIAAYGRAGFVEEGRCRQAVYRSGRYHDVLQFAILRDEWAEAATEAVAEARLSSLMT
jgi:RimJ/RimL family protein N-acetyltransferase